MAINVACCKAGVLQQIIVAPDVPWCQTNLSAQYDTFFDVDSYYKGGTTSQINAFLVSKGVSVPAPAANADAIGDLKVDIAQIAAHDGVIPTKPLA